MIKLGNNDITLKVGSADVSAAYLGSTLVYSGGTPPTPPTPTGDYKWLATYSDSHTESGACDPENMVIEEAEIELTDLVDVVIGDCVEEIGDRAFASCNSLSSVTIGSGVTTIGESAFARSSHITGITIPSGVTSIGYRAFNYCMGFNSVTVLATTPPTIGTQAFNRTDDCPIYVPVESVTAYQSAWTDYASRIQAIPEPSPQWVDYASGEIIPTDLDIYGVSGTADSLCTTFSYVDDTIYFHLERNAVIADIGPGCYSGSYPMSGNIEITFSDVVDAGCSDSYRLNHASHVITGVKLLIYQ